MKTKKNVSNIKYIWILLQHVNLKLLLVSISVQYLSLFLSVSLLCFFLSECRHFIWKALNSFELFHSAQIEITNDLMFSLRSIEKKLLCVVDFHHYCNAIYENLWQIEVRCVILFTILHFRVRTKRPNMIIHGMWNRLDWVRFDSIRFETHRIIVHFKFCMYINHDETYGFFRVSLVLLPSLT